MTGPTITVRRAHPADRPAVLALAVRALGWTGDERDRQYFAWKHDANPFGPSPAWVAESDGELVGFRTFLRWELTGDAGSLRCVRAVDTATDPAHQGRGIFRALTLHAVDELTAEGVDAVFNTPNSKSRPGYLSMGWCDLGRPALHVVPRGPGAVVRMARSREGADKWSDTTDVGEPAPGVLATDEAARLVAELPRAAGRMATVRSIEHLRWRYGFGPLRYRAVPVRGGWCVLRVRRRGRSTEVAVCEWLSADPDPRALRAVVRATGADYAVGIGLTVRGQGAVPLPGRGPSVTWRPLARATVPLLRDLGLGLGDLELL